MALCNIDIVTKGLVPLFIILFYLKSDQIQIGIRTRLEIIFYLLYNEFHALEKILKIYVIPVANFIEFTHSKAFGGNQGKTSILSM